MSNRSIPTYELYGEFLSGNDPDPIHHETIRERSSRYHWTIRLHRHRRLAQIFVFRTSGVSVRLGDVTHNSIEPVLLYIPPGVPHGFRFSEDVAGDVLSLRADELREDIQRVFDKPAMQSGARLMPQSRTPYFRKMEAVLAQLRDAYHGMDIGRTELLGDLTRLTLTYLSAEVQRDSLMGSLSPSMQPTAHEALAEEFCAMVERNFSKSGTVTDFADTLGVSAPHLTRVCRKVLGLPPNELVRQRRLLEAKRLLEYTRLPISEVSHRSGFRDPAFFSRSFSRATGLSPKSYRIQHNH